MLKRFLEAGHTVRELHETLRVDGINIHYNNLCTYIARLRESDPEAKAAVRSIAGSPDPLDNVRRLTERERPGFHYQGTPSEEKLLGKK